ncbi:MAG: accessory gene regulator B family protein [Lachnospiraceae bacterium]|nr:accessory gene regulator B family protein [Lachnospiraceae bacterium]
MLERFARKVTGKLIDYKCIVPAQKEDYVYAMVMAMEKWITLSAIIVIGVYFRVVISTIFFLIFLFAIKRRSGGFHANNFETCFLVTIGTYVGFVTLLMPIMLKTIELTYIALSISIVILELIGAVNHPNMNWNMEEYMESKSASRLVVAMEGMFIIVFVYLGGNEEVIVFMAFAVIISALLLLLAKISKQEVSNEKRNN